LLVFLCIACKLVFLLPPFMPRKARLSEQERQTRQADRQSTRRSSTSSLLQVADLDSLARQRIARVRDTDRQRVRRQTLADATDADGSSRRQARLERARELQRLRRARLRNHSTNGSASTVSSSLLPLHQREAIDALRPSLNNLRRTRARGTAPQRLRQWDRH
jgi:hypothetical protein